jgi:LmbE family N-acetylglucosaminyl deacetylase
MTTILAVTAHPDDETMAAGGTLAMYAQKGHTVYILATTRGEGGEVGEPPAATREELGATREAELRAAAQILGVREVFFLPFVDPPMEIGGSPRAIETPLTEFTAAITDYLRQLNPRMVLTHGSNGEYGHPQHVLTHEAVCRAVHTYALPITLLTWGAQYPNAERPEMLNRDDKADFWRDVTPWMEQKVAAAMCHRSQHAMFLRNTKKDSVAAMVPRVESFAINTC